MVFAVADGLLPRDPRRRDPARLLRLAPTADDDRRRAGGRHVKHAEFRGIAPDHVIGERIAIQTAQAPHELSGAVLRLLGGMDLGFAWTHVYSARGAIIATARVPGFEKGYASLRMARLCVSEALDDDQARRVLRMFEFQGQTAWRLDDVVALPRPVKCAGALGIWTLPAYVAHEVAEMEAVARGAGPLPGVTQAAREAVAESLPRQGRLF